MGGGGGASTGFTSVMKSRAPGWCKQCTGQDFPQSQPTVSWPGAENRKWAWLSYPSCGGQGETKAYLGGSSGEGDLCNWTVTGQRDREGLDRGRS